MKMTLKTAPGSFLLVDDQGTEHPITTHRPALWKQGIVVLPPTIPTEGVVAMQDPSDEESEMTPIEDGIWHPKLAELQRRWAAGDLEDGDHGPIDLD